KKLDAANQEKGTATQGGETALQAKQKELQAKDQKIKELTDRLADLNTRLEVMEKKTAEAPGGGRPIPTDWKIVEMDRSGKAPFINLGSADGVHTGLTFSIHGRGPDGRPVLASKGTLELIDVVNDHLSQTQVVSVKDALKDPILPGDFLYNPIF